MDSRSCHLSLLPDELCQQCQVSDPHYQELNSPSDEDETSNDGDASLLPGLSGATSYLLYYSLVMSEHV